MPPTLNGPQLVFFAILLIAFVLLITERIRNDLVAILIVLALYAFGSVPDSEVSERKDSEPVMERTFSIARPA